jgi:hypothetical protein
METHYALYGTNAEHCRRDEFPLVETIPQSMVAIDTPSAWDMWKRYGEQDDSGEHAGW